MRALPVLLLIAGCGRAEAPVDPPAGTEIACALDGAADFAAACRVERTTRGGRTLLTLVRPDGGFHRVEAGADGAGLRAADGARGLGVVQAAAGSVEITAGRDRYRLTGAR